MRAPLEETAKHTPPTPNRNSPRRIWGRRPSRHRVVRVPYVGAPYVARPNLQRGTRTLFLPTCLLAAVVCQACYSRDRRPPVLRSPTVSPSIPRREVPIVAPSTSF
ncbi:hypothetical protein TIFTF001_017029 [Ficus carica]|uniref:Uncharacterized protein n=1 Tax=Ficus carica TaxID=3494 RepID=A0AA88DAC8_FICCA|nr:hypothetical protein TIFTF001_017029 [Ficus carica]